MSGLPKRKHPNPEEPFPGCLGRMVNLFDLSAGMARNRLLTDKPHRDGPLQSRTPLDAAKMSPSGEQKEENLRVSQPGKTSSNTKSNATPVKMLIAQEMSKRIDPKHNTPSVVAKLMGLDGSPGQQPETGTRKSQSGAYVQSHSGTSPSYWQRKSGSLNAHMPPERDQLLEFGHQPQKKNFTRNKPFHKGIGDESVNDKTMDLVRRKFTEAKRLVTDGKLQQSKQFQDAVDVLSSNTDLFLKILQEPTSFFYKQIYNLQSVPPDTKRITVLKPSIVEDSCKSPGSGNKNEKHLKKPTISGQVSGMNTSHEFSPPATSLQVDENPSQTTRIVVLKPNHLKPLDFETLGSPLSSSRNKFEDSVDGEARISGEIEEEVFVPEKRQHTRDQTLFPSVYSNGYTGDESSFNQSEKEYTAGVQSDSDVMSLSSRHSWDYHNKFDMPFSPSSLSRASYSADSSVSREAKKRLSERWAMMALNGDNQKQRHIWRSSSTLGEMLALSDLKEVGKVNEEKSKDDRKSNNQIGNPINGEGMDRSPLDLQRSNSLPILSSVFASGSNVDIPDPDTEKTDAPKKAAKEKGTKSSFKGKVSNLFFSKNKKSTKDKPNRGQSKDFSLSEDPNATKFPTNSGGECLSPGITLPSSKASSFGIQGSLEVDHSVTRPTLHGNRSENQEQPSPVSVLEPPFEDDEHATPLSSSMQADQHGVESLLPPTKSSVIDKSPLIGSIARTLSWEDSFVDTALSYSVKPSLSTQEAEEDEQEWFDFVRTLLLVAGLDGEVRSAAFSSRWHSPESPLDPLLREKYIDLNEQEIPNEAKRRQRRSFQKLVFDCVNAALIDIGVYGSETSQTAKHSCWSCSNVMDSFIVVEQVWERIKQWLTGENISDDYDDNDSLTVENMVMKEVIGKGLLEYLGSDQDTLALEIEADLLDELVRESIAELTYTVSIY